MYNFEQANKMWGDRGDDQTKDAPKTEYEDVPDGNYIVYIDKVAWKTSRANNMYLSWQLRFLKGDFEGRCIFKQSMCTSPENMRFLSQDLRAIGVEPPSKLDELNLEKLLDHAMEVRQYTKERDRGSFTNIYFNKRLGTRNDIIMAGPSGPDVGARYNDEDMPF